MREGFEQDLHLMNKMAKDQLRSEGGDQEVDATELETALGYNLKFISERQSSNPETQKKIFDIQKKKQEIMQTLNRQIAELDDPEVVREKKAGAGQIKVIYDHNKKYRRRNGEYITLGELMTDGEWGIKYFTSQSIPRNVRKRFLIESAKRELRHYLDEQIVESEVSNTTVRPKIKHAYLSNQESVKELTPSASGLIAERMVANYLKKIIFDNDINLVFRDADIFQDVVKKLDFIIHRKEYYRGARIETNETAKDMGVQFTINATEDRIAHKIKQISRSKVLLNEEDRVQDIVLVSLNMERVLPTYIHWNKKKTSGGPDKLWSPELKKQIFYGVLEKMFSKEELDDLWNKITTES